MSKHKRIFVISNMYPSYEDNFYGIFVKNFIGNFENSPIDVISVSTINGRGKNSFIKLKKYFHFYISILINILKFNYDVIYVHYPSYASPPLLMVLPLIKKPLIINFHGSDAIPKTKISALLNFLLKPLIQRSALIVVPSPYFKQIVLEQFKITVDKIYISPSGGIDTSKFKPLGYKKDDSNFTLGYVGRIDEGKGWDIFLIACSSLKLEIPNLKCIIAGNGSQSTNLEKMMKDLEMSHFTSILGPVPHSELPQLFNQFDLFIFPTKAESLGLVGIEGLACGVPVVGSRIEALRDYIVDDVNGKLFEPGNPEDLAKNILRLYKNEKLTKKLREAARGSIENYDKKIVSQKLTEKLEKIVYPNE